MQPWGLAKAFNRLFASACLLALAACSAKTTLDLHPASDLELSPPQRCKARALLVFESRETKEKIRSAVSIDFLLQESSSRMKMNFFSPFGTRLGVISIDRQNAIWSDAKDQVELKRHALFANWHKENWWEEMAFIFGLLTPGTLASTQVDKMDRPRVLKYADREIRCDYLESNQEKICNIDLLEVFGRVELQRYECAELNET